MQLKSNVYIMPLSCAGKAFHIIYTSASCWGMSKTTDIRIDDKTTDHNIQEYR
jgi:hypothetical protein